jgi:regulator of nucleoside diphosphate kinase
MLVLVLAGFVIILDIPMSFPEIIVTSQDAERLNRLLDVLPEPQRIAAQALEAEIARAEIVPPDSVPHDVVTMNSRVVFEDTENGKRSEATLVYPHDADGTANRISVLAPVGSALLGLRVGQMIDWQLPTGRRRRYKVVSVTYQPEAAGDFNL